MAEWRPLTITDRQAKAGAPGRPYPDTCWTLSTHPPTGWSEDFDLAGGGRTGSGIYQTSGDPKVRGNAIVWTVPLGDLADADRHVKTRVAAANARYPERLAKSAARAEKAEAETAERAASVAEYQAELDRLNEENS